jgi:hypothetical protein
MTERKPWFRAKTIGYGAGLPIAWQGWAVIAVFALAIVVSMLASDLFLEGWLRTGAKAAGVLVSIIIFSVVVRGRTDGGWRWRDGSE